MSTGAPSEVTPVPGQDEPAGEATVLRMLLGAQLRRLTEATKLTGVTSQVVPSAQGVEHYLEVAGQLSGKALAPAGTVRFIEQAACET